MDKQKETQTNRDPDLETDRHSDRQTVGQTDRQTDVSVLFHPKLDQILFPFVFGSVMHGNDFETKAQ